MEKSTAINNILRDVMFWIDRLIYGMIPKVYNLIIDVAEANIFKDYDMKSFATSLYVIMGLFMLFRLVFSLLNSIVNPDLLTDQEQGFGKIIQRSMIALTLVTAVPLLIFPYSIRVQHILVGRENNIFMRLFMGVHKSDINAGQMVGEHVLIQFIECVDEDFCGLNEQNQPKNDDTRPVEYLIQDLEYLYPMSEVLNKTNEQKEYIYKYSPLLSFPCGLFVLIMLLVFSIDIAVRTIKFGFLQLITPIAVLSYIDPKSSKDGFFSKWTKACTSTYLLLFFRMAALAFMILIIALIGKFKENNPDTNGWVIILLILGVIFFAKELPKMLGDLFGIEDVGMGTLGKALKGTATLGAGLALGGAATALGGIAGGITGGVEGGRKNILGGAWSGIKSGAGGVWGAKGNVLGMGKAALTSPFKTVGDVGKGIKGDGYRWGLGRTADKWQAEAQRGAYLKKQKDDEKATENIWEQMSAAEATAEIRGEDSMGQAMAKINAEQNAYDSDSFKTANRNYQVLKEQLKYASNDFAVTENKFRTGSLSEDKYREELIKFKKLEGSAKTAEQNFTTVKEAHKKDGEMYDLIRAREDAEKVTEAAGNATSSAPSTSSTPRTREFGKSYIQRDDGLWVPDK